MGMKAFVEALPYQLDQLEACGPTLSTLFQDPSAQQRLSMLGLDWPLRKHFRWDRRSYCQLLAADGGLLPLLRNVIQREEHLRTLVEDFFPAE